MKRFNKTEDWQRAIKATENFINPDEPVMVTVDDRTIHYQSIPDQIKKPINVCDLSVIDDVCADDFEVEIARKGTDESVIGAEGLKAIYEEYLAASPDIHYEIDTIVADDEHVAVFNTPTGTHEGEFRGIEPTGNEIEVQDAGVVRVEDGKIVDLRPNPNMLGLFEQLGVQLYL